MRASPRVWFGFSVGWLAACAYWQAWEGRWIAVSGYLLALVGFVLIDAAVQRRLNGEKVTRSDVMDGES